MDRIKLAKSFLEDLKNLCAKHKVNITGGNSGNVKVDGSFKMSGLAASAYAASGQLDGEFTAPYLRMRVINNENLLVMEDGALISEVGTFVGVNESG